MSGFIEGESRTQATLFPESLDEYVSEENMVRVIDVFIDELDLSDLGFKTQAEATGRPAYHPATLLKLYVYGYLNRVQSSRRLERETQRNIEVMWLTGRLAPDFKTIADFRKNNGHAICKVCRQFVVLCRELHLFTEAFVAIDGSKFKAVNNRNKNFTKAKIKGRLKQIDDSIERYLAEIASADRREQGIASGKTQRLEDKITALKEEVAKLKQIEAQMLAEPDQQLSLTDPDARAIATAGRGKVIVGYNVQAAVDTTHHLMVAHEVTNDTNDRSQLENLSKQAKSAMGVESLDAVADRGYFKSEEILACEQAGINTYVPKPQTSSNQAKGQFGRRDFIYIAKDDEYECPAGERLIYRFSRHESNKLIRRYWASACTYCSLKPQCTTGQYRRVSRWEHEAVLDKVEARLQQKPESMRIRRQTVEHPFGTLKAWMGSTHFQMKTLKHVSTEMSLHVLAYNLKRMINILGVIPLIEAIRG